MSAITTRLHLDAKHELKKINIANRLLLMASKLHFHGTTWVSPVFSKLGTSADIQGGWINPKKTSYTSFKYTICPCDNKACYRHEEKRKELARLRRIFAFIHDSIDGTWYTIRSVYRHETVPDMWGGQDFVGSWTKFSWFSAAVLWAYLIRKRDEGRGPIHLCPNVLTVLFLPLAALPWRRWLEPT